MNVSERTRMLAYLFIAFAIFMRFLPTLGLHPYAFMPVGAALLFFGARMPRHQMWVPVALLAATDVVLTTVFYRYAITPDHYVTWAWYAGTLLLASGWLKNNERPLRLGATAAANSVAFFLLSNGAVWLFSNMYPPTAAGLAMSYAAGLPFFPKALASDVMFTALFFGVAAALEARQAQAARVRA